MDDLISREKLKQKFCRHCEDYGKCKEECFDLRIINSMPTAEPRKGKWVDGQCSNCSCDVPAYIIDWKWKKDMNANYCPNCGAKMEESDE